MERRSFIKAIMAVGAVAALKPVASLLPKANASVPTAIEVGKEIEKANTVLTYGVYEGTGKDIHINTEFDPDGVIIHRNEGPLPKRLGKTVKFRRYEKLPPVTEPLTEGLKPSGRRLAFKDHKLGPAFYPGKKIDIGGDTHDAFAYWIRAAEMNRKWLERLSMTLAENAAKTKENIFMRILNKVR